MVAAHELDPLTETDEAGATVVLTMPVAAWLALRGLADSPEADRTTRRPLRRALGSVTQVDSVVHAAVMVREGGIEDLSVHTHRSGAEAALVGWLRGQPELWEGLGYDDWIHMVGAGVAPAALIGSTTLTVPVGTARGGDGG